MVTIRDVAARAGVSLATASRALNGSGPVSPEAQQRVVRAAKELEYQVNHAASSLRTRHSNMVGLLISDVRNPFFSELAYHIERNVVKNGRSLLTMNADESTVGQERALKAFTRARIDGLLIVAQHGEVNAAEIRCPAIFVDRAVEGSTTAVIQSDNYLAAEQLVQHLYQLGHRRIGVISGPVATSAGRQRLDGVLSSLKKLAIPAPSEWIRYGDFKLESGLSAARSLFELADRPTAIIACDNLMALGALHAAQALGIRIGDDIGLVAIDDTPWFPVIDPPLTVAAQDIATIAATAVSALEEAMQGHQPHSANIPTTLCIRKSGTVREEFLAPNIKERISE
ncbi:LacI family DNA-binding transcriptional regulator [Corynebacterium caspium]|uniref:LacI family DNA-binding transcriptional regulator n=1 Tax=Corynebacterium caspium TaxID=234828 RepID=UPI000366BFF6|nr:LacI family DNA-binding transcriptional regulator [Corynebacterium caspium]WKD58952.1 HTH-type transcriptional repressor PurR [Corynebacterium caspium DSM 44850]